MHTRLVYGLVLTAAATLAATQTRRATALERRRAAAHAAGYQQGIMHAAAGLLEPDSTRVDDTERTQQ